MHFVEHLFGRQLELYTRSFLTKDRSHAVFIFIIIACECSPQDWNNNGDDFWNAVLVCGQVRFDLFLRQLKRQSSSMEVPFPMINLWRGKRKMWRVSNNFYHIFKIMLKLKELFFFFFFFPAYKTHVLTVKIQMSAGDVAWWHSMCLACVRALVLVLSITHSYIHIHVHKLKYHGMPFRMLEFCIVNR